MFIHSSNRPSTLSRVCLLRIAHTSCGTQGAGMKTFNVFPRMLDLKSDHLRTSPSPRRHLCDISWIVFTERMEDHRLRLVRKPWKDWLDSNWPPQLLEARKSWSCLSITIPFPLMVYPCLRPVSFLIRSPSMYNCQEPSLFVHEKQIWCHLPSFVNSVKLLPLLKIKNKQQCHFSLYCI